MKIFDYTTSGGKNVITNYIEKLPAGDRAAIYFIRNLIEEDGLLAFDVLDTKPLYKRFMKSGFLRNVSPMFWSVKKEFTFYIYSENKKAKPN